VSPLTADHRRAWRSAVRHGRRRAGGGSGRPAPRRRAVAGERRAVPARSRPARV